MHKMMNPGRHAGFCNSFGEPDMRFFEVRAERLARTTVQDPDQIDDGINPCKHLFKSRVVVNIGLHYRNRWHGQQLSGIDVATGWNNNLMALGNKPGYQVFADKTGTANNRDTHDVYPFE